MPRQQQPQTQTTAANNEILHLKVELHHIKQQLQYINTKTESEWQLGYHKGRCDGFDDTMNMFPPSRASPRTGEREPLHLELPQDDPNEHEARQLRQAMEESQRTAQKETRGPATSGAGPS